jgi:hypothetical protein
MFKYRRHWADGEDAGQAAYADCVNPGDEILMMQRGKLRTLQVLDLVLVAEGQLGLYDGVLRVEAA